MLNTKLFFTDQEANLFAQSVGGSVCLEPTVNPPWKATWTTPDPEPVKEPEKPVIRSRRIKEEANDTD